MLRISQLPEQIKKLALLRQKEAGFPPNENIELNVHYRHGFDWGKTPEGHDFWKEINVGNFDVFDKKYPLGIDYLFDNKSDDIAKNKIIKEVLKKLSTNEPIELDKSIMIKLTYEEILNIAKMGAKYWKGACDSNTTKSMEEVCKFHVDVAVGILSHTDPDRFITNN